MRFRSVTPEKAKKPLALHAELTVLVARDARRRTALASSMRNALQGLRGAKASVVLDGTEKILSVDLARRLGLERARIDVMLTASDLAGLGGPRRPEQPSEPEPVAPAIDEQRRAAAEAEVAAGRARLDEARSAFDPEAAAARDESDRRVAELQPRLAAAEERLGAARIARRAAEEVARQRFDAARAAEARTRELTEQVATLEVRRAALDAGLADAERLADFEPVQQALDGLRRLREVRPRPSSRGVAIAEKWSRYLARQRGEVPELEAPPEYLAAPARAALDIARSAVAEAGRAAAEGAQYSRADVEQLERAHRALLEAEQRLDAKPSRLNRRRYESAQIAERSALERLDVSGYADYLQRVVPAVRAGGAAPDLESARAALADAEAVWEELHDGFPPMSPEELVELVAAIRADAFELLGREATDDELEAALRAHTEPVVETEWARDALAAALEAVGVTPTGDVEALATDWLAHGDDRTAVIDNVRSQITSAEAELEQMRRELAAMADAVPAAPHPETSPDVPSDEDLASLEAEAARVRTELDVAGVARSEAAARADAADAAAARVKALEDDLARAEAAFAEASTPIVEPVREDRVSEEEVPRAGASPLEARLYVLARLAAHRNVPAAGALPVIVDGAFDDLDPALRDVLLIQLARLAPVVQVVYLTGSDAVATWAESLDADRRTVHRGIAV